MFMLVFAFTPDLSIPVKLKNPPINPVLEARIVVKKEAEVKVTTYKARVSRKIPPAPKVRELDKAKMTLARGNKWG